MAQKVNIVLVDDLDESEASETVSFALDGTSYEIDLNDEHAAELRDAMALYVGNARKVASGGRRPRKAGGSSSSAADSGPSAKEIREWARANGHDVPERGRIPAEVREAFDAAH